MIVSGVGMARVQNYYYYYEQNYFGGLRGTVQKCGCITTTS